ncbi:MAG: metal-dependent transcriptional regulator [bacterium]
MPKQELSPNLEDYLETIYELCQQDGIARVKDIAARLSVTNPSAVGAIKALKRRDLVSQERYGYVRLTLPGQEQGAAILHKHGVLTNFLENVLGLDAETASQDACRLEHAASPETVRRLLAFAEFVKDKRDGSLGWHEAFRLFYRKRTGIRKA